MLRLLIIQTANNSGFVLSKWFNVSDKRHKEALRNFSHSPQGGCDKKNFDEMFRKCGVC